MHKLNFKIVVFLMGILLLFNGGLMLLSSLISFVYKDGITFEITFDPRKQIPSTVYKSTVDAESTPLFSGGGSKNKSKQIRKHQGIYQSGPKQGKLKPGYCYSGKKSKTGLQIIVRK